MFLGKVHQREVGRRICRLLLWAFRAWEWSLKVPNYHSFVVLSATCGSRCRFGLKVSGCLKLVGYVDVYGGETVCDSCVVVSADECMMKSKSYGKLFPVCEVSVDENFSSP